MHLNVCVIQMVANVVNAQAFLSRLKTFERQKQQQGTIQVQFYFFFKNGLVIETSFPEETLTAVPKKQNKANTN